MIPPTNLLDVSSHFLRHDDVCMKELLHRTTPAATPADTLVHCEARARACRSSLPPNIVSLRDDELEGVALMNSLVKVVL